MIKIRPQWVKDTLIVNLYPAGVLYVSDKWPKELDIDLFLASLFGSCDQYGWYICHEDAGQGRLELMRSILTVAGNLPKEILVMGAILNEAKLDNAYSPIGLLKASGAAAYLLQKVFDATAKESGLLVRLNLSAAGILK